MTRLALALARLQGSCPVCGDDVPRAKVASADGVHETYSCPRHGLIDYGPRSFSLLKTTNGPLLAASVPRTAVWEV